MFKRDEGNNVPAPDAWVWDVLREQDDRLKADARQRARSVKPLQLPGGCLLYRFPARLRAS